MFRDRIIALMQDKKIYASELARKIGVSRGAVSAWTTGRNEPDLETIQRIAEALGVSMSDLTDPNQTQSTTPPTKDRNMVFLPLLEVTASAGPGSIQDHTTDRISRMIQFNESWLLQELGGSTENLCVLEVEGESMTPTLVPGEMIIVKKAMVPQVGDGLYVVRLDGVILVKRVQRVPGGRIRITSDNERYAPYDIDPRNPPDDFQIVGRVVWSGRRR